MSSSGHDGAPAAAAGAQDARVVRGSRSRLVRELAWRRMDVPGIEYFRLWESAAGPRLTGTVILAQAGSPCRLKYAVACAPDWTTLGVHVALTQSAETRHVKLTAGDSGGGWRWRRGADEMPEVAGCRDVDLAFTPSTNILPLRRLGLAPGESRQVTAAWLRFPELTVEPLAQRYTRLDERRVQYESRGGAFTAELEVDELGLVVRYPPAWERVALGQA
ncbi:MAG TPA: putative glycolipid-binding domain-containing protein [Thermoanaerobaculia bacterium]|nr:putative glycolipid-binding domain-containing protein [Thermoanaerobaculia bacterium]